MIGEIEKLEAVRKLGAMHRVLRNMTEMIDQMTEAAKTADAPALAFSSQMLREAIVTFQDELTRYVARRIAE